MKTAIWICVIFAVAVGLTLITRYTDGYVLVVVPPWRVELALNLALLLAFAGFVISYLLLRFIATAVGLPRQVREFRARRRGARAQRVLQEALTNFFEGRYGKAEKAAVKAMKLKEEPALSATLAARSAHQLRAFDRRDRYLAQAPEEGALPIVTKVDFLLDEERHLEALSALQSLQPKHTMARKLELKAQQQAKNWDRVLVLLQQLEKLQALDAIELKQFRRQAHVENLNRKTLDAAELLEYWKRLLKADRRDSQIAAAAARSFIALNRCDNARDAIEESLNFQWEDSLLPLYAECVGGDALTRIERAERWLNAHPDDSELLLTLGKLCAHQGLWGKAQSYFDASLALNGSHAAHLALAKLYERNNPEKACQHYQKGFAIALSELREEKHALLPPPG